jgi:hypothetical protein
MGYFSNGESMERREAIAWAAGLFEGEGCITSHRDSRGSHYLYLMLALTMTDEDTVTRFAAICGLPAPRMKVRGSGRKDIWFTETGKYAEVIRIMTMLEPYLGLRRRARWEELHAAYLAEGTEHRRERVCPGCGSSFVSPNRKANRVYCTDKCQNRTSQQRLRTRRLKRSQV